MTEIQYHTMHNSQSESLKEHGSQNGVFGPTERITYVSIKSQSVEAM